MSYKRKPMKGHGPSGGEITSIILAGGEGKRMRSALPKVLHSLCGKPMIDYVIETVVGLKKGKALVVVPGQGPNDEDFVTSFPLTLER